MFKKQMKKIDVFDVGLIKWGVAFAVLFLITACSTFRELVLTVHWGWFLAATILVLIIPVINFTIVDTLERENTFTKSFLRILFILIFCLSKFIYSNLLINVTIL